MPFHTAPLRYTFTLNSYNNAEKVSPGCRLPVVERARRSQLQFIIHIILQNGALTTIYCVYVCLLHRSDWENEPEIKATESCGVEEVLRIIRRPESISPVFS